MRTTSPLFTLGLRASSPGWTTDIEGPNRDDARSNKQEGLQGTHPKGKDPTKTPEC